MEIVSAMRTLLAALLLAVPLHADTAALLAVECEAVDGACAIQHLVRFRFENGALVSKDTVLTSNTVRFDLGENRIYRNRYILTEWGDVVDIQQKKVLHEGRGTFVAADGDRIINRLNRVDAEGLFVYDLATQKYARLRAPGKWALPGLLSPDQTKSVEAPQWRGSEIWLHRLDGKKRLLGDKFDVELDERCCSFPRPPFLWLDDDRILTQRHNGEIVVVRLDGTIEPVVKIPITESSMSLPEFFRDRNGRIVYECSSRSFAIDVENKSYAPYEWLSLGFDFEAQRKIDESYGYVIRHRGEEIGRWWVSTWEAPTADGWLAMEYGDTGSNLGYPKGIKVWSRASGQWTTIDLQWVTALIGWVEE